MEQEGYETVSVKSLQEGDFLFHKEIPDVVVLDLALPDGDDFCKRIRELPKAGAEAAILSLKDQAANILRRTTTVLDF